MCVLQDRCHPEDSTSVDVEGLLAHDGVRAPAPSPTSTTAHSAPQVHSAAPGHSGRGGHHLVPLGLIPDAYCSCNKTTCAVLSGQDTREYAGYKYDPRPVDITGVELAVRAGDGERDALVQALSVFLHESWARERIAAGWTAGKRRDTTNRTHPNLVPYGSLSEQSRRNLVQTASEFLRTVVAVGYQIDRARSPAPDSTRPLPPWWPCVMRAHLLFVRRCACDCTCPLLWS